MIIHLRAIGTEGRFGNSLIHYVVGKTYAEQMGAAVEIPPGWIARELFDIHDQRFFQPSPYFNPSKGGPPPKRFSLPPYWDLAHELVDPMIVRSNFQRWLKPAFKFPESLVPMELAIHVRRGDYLTDGFPIVSEDHLVNEARRLGFSVDDIAWVHEDRPRMTQLRPAFLTDWTRMLLAKNVMVYPRSSFSQTAALLGNGRIFMPINYTGGETTCTYEERDPEQSCAFETRLNSL